MGDVMLLWILTGAVSHIIECCRMKTWCGTPIWAEPSTYMMFFPAMLMGPFYWVAVLLSEL